MRTRSDFASLTRPLTGLLTATAAAAVTLLAAPAGAQGRWGGWGRSNGNGGYDETAGGARPLFQWSGRVDREALIVMQNGSVNARVDGNGGFYSGDGRARVNSGLPQADGIVDVRVLEGRGRVEVLEQPTASNGYRTVVRVRDDDAGAGYYRLATTWRPTGGYAEDGRYGRRRRGDDDGRYGDDRDRDGRDRDGRYGDGRYGDGRYGDGTYGNGRYSGSGTLHWRGRVDDVEEIRIQGGRVETRTVSGAGASGVRSGFSGGTLPARDVSVRVDDRSGRGRVVVVQQPRSWNGYTAVVRVEDRDSGPGWYDFDVSW